jgi:cytochrome c biogenesis protein CcdA
VESEGVGPRRYVIAGAVLVVGFLVGLVLTLTFRWYPYFWQWLAYHTGIVMGVFIYLLLSAFRENTPTETLHLFAYTHPQARRPGPSELAAWAEWQREQRLVTGRRTG